MRDMTPPPARDGDVVLGDDWVAPESAANNELRVSRERRGLMSLRTSPLTRKIITFNLIALNILVAGILYLNSSRDSLAIQRASSLVSEAELIADTIEVQLPAGAPVNMATKDGVDVASTLLGLDLRSGIEVFVFDASEQLIANTEGQLTASGTVGDQDGKTLITDGLSWVWSKASNLVSDPVANDAAPLWEKIRPLVGATLTNGTQIRNELDTAGGALFTVVTPIVQADKAIGAVAVVTASGEIDSLVRGERERVLQMFVIATLVSVGLSLVLASTIANPLQALHV